MFKIKVETNDFHIFSKKIEKERMLSLVEDIYGTDILGILNSAIDMEQQYVSIVNNKPQVSIHLTRISWHEVNLKSACNRVLDEIGQIQKLNEISKK